MKLCTTALLLCGLAHATWVPRPTWAASDPTTAVRITQIDPSARSVAMGEASGAVCWGWSANHWANPALLGNRSGLAYEYSHARFSPVVARNLVLTTNVLVAGYGGLGLAWGDWPRSAGLRLKYGGVITAPEHGTGETFEPQEQAAPWALGLSLGTLTESIADRLFKRRVRVVDLVDIALGLADRRVLVDRAPAWASTSGVAVKGSVRSRDAGILVRVRPIGIARRTARDLGDLIDHHVDVDVAFGRSRQNGNGAAISFPTGAEPVARLDRTSWAVRGEVRVGHRAARCIEAIKLGWLIPAGGTLVSATWARDRVEPSNDGSPSVQIGDTATSVGWEFILGDFLAYRFGRRNVGVDVSRNSHGWGVRAPFGRFVRVEYDRSINAQEWPIEEDAARNAVSVHVDLAGILREEDNSPSSVLGPE